MAGARSARFSGRIEKILLLPVMDYRTAVVTSGRSRNLDEEAGRCSVVDAEKGESGTIPYTISEKFDFSYGLGRRGAEGSLTVGPDGFFPTLRIIISSPHLLFLYSL